MNGEDARRLNELLCAALRAHATRLALDPASITSPAPGAITARGMNGSLLRVDYRNYQPSELSR